LDVRWCIKISGTDVLGDFQYDRTWTTGTGQCKGPPESFGDSVRTGYAEGPFGDRREGLKIGDFLKHPFSKRFTGAMAKQNHQGDAVGEGVDNGCQGIRASRSLCHQGDSRFSGASGIPIRRENGRLFMAGENQGDLRAFVKCIKKRKDVVARKSGYESYPLGFQNFNDVVGYANVNPSLLITFERAS